MTDPTQSGYFRLGSVELQIPPSDITTNKIINDDQVATIRSVTPMFIKSGQARWDVTIHWKAVRNPNTDGTYDYSQWKDLRRVIATFRASPFVEVENDFIRQHLTDIQLAYRQERMAFALKQLRIDTDPNTTNVLDVTLTMTLFNYAPYSVDFSYIGTSGDSSDAIDSSLYNNYINNWMSINMDNSPNPKGEPFLTPWDQQEAGVITFKWRKYCHVPFVNPPPSGAPTGGATVPTLTPTPPQSNVPKGVTSKKLSSDIQAMINTSAAKYGLDPAIVSAQCLVESGGNPRAISRTGAIGLFQLLASTARGLGVDPYDPAQNIDGGCKYLAQQYKTFKNYPHALGAYNAGAAYIYAYRDGKTQSHGTINPQKIKTADGLPPAGTPSGENVPLYVSKILTNAKRTQYLTTTPSVGTSVPAATAQVPQPLTATLAGTTDPNLLAQINQAFLNLPDGIWLLDHFTNDGAFFYEEESILLTSADSASLGDYDVYPQQISIAFVNNLPMIPLAGMQYPTYQHVGPTDTIISIGMNSIGDDNNIMAEPAHEGIHALADMSSTLEQQFLNMRNDFRAVSSVHRMQAVFMENQLLNMLGIRGTMLRGINTETVPDAANLVQVSLMASQYENIFEESGPYRINGINQAYRPALQNLMKGDALSKASAAEQKALFVVKSFSDAWKSHDENYLATELLRMLKDPIDYLDRVNTPATDLWYGDRDQLLNALELSGTPTLSSLTGSTGLGSILHPSAISLAPLQSATYQGLQIRRTHLIGKTTQLNYADYFVFSHLPLKFDAPVADIKTRMDAKFASQKSDIIEAMYVQLFDYELVTNPQFSGQAKLLVNSPGFKSQVTNTVTVYGPSSQDENRGHFCYKDLGLTDYATNPDSYFTDYNEILSKTINAELVKTIGTATTAAGIVNATTTTAANANLAAAGQNGFTCVDSTGAPDPNGIPGGANSLSRMYNMPAFSLNSAFPTYKLMLIEEDNSGPFFAFDNFYSYSSVIDIEVIKYHDKPDTAIIQITNLAHILQHRLYDDTAAGKLDQADDQFNIAPNGALVQGGPNVDANSISTGGNPTSSINAGKFLNGDPYQNKDMSEGRGTDKRVPLRYFALQTGSKIQVRLGYSNNPDNLFPVFTGQVTEIEGDEVLTLTCQSFQLELMNTPGTTIITDGRFGFNVLSGGSAMGGWSISNAGDTDSVIEKMLGAEPARHFGRFQINTIPDQMLKGFTWTDLGGKLISNVPNSTVQNISALLQTGYDRSGENVLVNSIINYDSTKSPQANKARRTFDENTSWIQSALPIGSASYSIPKQSELSVWDIIKDVSRRYPHFNLLVKDYGFPYGADATLVYAHPLDWYYRRPMLYGDAEKEKANNKTQGQLFQTWWSSIGSAKWDAIWVASKNRQLDLFGVATGVSPGEAFGTLISTSLASAQQTMTQEAASGPEGFVAAIQEAHGILSGTNTVRPFTNSAGDLISLLQIAENITTKLAISGNLTNGFFQNLDANFQAILREWEQYLIQADPAANSSRLRPVRQYHLIDHNHIIKNNISINDNIYNAVKIMDEAPLKFNQNILGQHTRTLVATELINNPNLNCNSIEMKRVYAQSILREEVGKMYRGEIILRGIPEIEPLDIILLNDPSTGTVGPVEVETVIHSFNLENGYITIVKPRAQLIANESVSMNINRALGLAWSNAYAEVHGLSFVFAPTGKDSTFAGTVSGAALVGGAIVAVTLGALVVPAAVLLVSLALLSGYGIITWINSQQNQNFFKIMPLSRFGRPWIGGLQGFHISDFSYSVLHTLKDFDANEISPTIESWNDLLHYKVDYPQIGPNALTP